MSIRLLLSSVLKQFLAFVLIIQFAFLPIPRADEAPGYHVYEGEAPQSEMRSVTSALLHMTEQTLTIMNLQGHTQQSFRLEEANLMMPEVLFQSLSELSYSVVDGHLRIRFSDRNFIYEHSIAEVGELTAKPVVSGNFLIIATTNGTMVLPIRLMQKEFFTKPVPLLRLAVQPANTQVTKIEVLNLDDSEQRQWLKGFSGKRLAFDGDLLLDLELTNPEGQREAGKVLIPRNQMITSIKNQLITFLLFNEIINRSQGESPFLLRLLEEHRGRLTEMIKQDAGGIDAALGEKGTKVEMAMARFGASGRKVLEAVLVPQYDRATNSQLPSGFEELANAPRFGQSIESLSHLDAAATETAFQTERETTEAILSESARIMQSPGTLRVMAQALKKAKDFGATLLASRVTAFAAGTATLAGAAYFGDPESLRTAALALIAHTTETYNTMAGLELDAATLIDSTKTWAQNLASKYVNVYWVSATVGALAVLPFFLYTARLIRSGGDRERGLFVRAFELGTMVLARLNNAIPFILEKGFDQKLLYPAMREGLGPQFNRPGASSEALKSQVKDLSEQIYKKTAANQLSSYITALITSTYIHNKKVETTGQGSKVDITTLMTVDQLKQYRTQGLEGKAVTTLEILADPEVRKLWDKLYPSVSEMVLAELNKPNAGSDITEESVRAASSRLKVILHEIEQINNPTISSLLNEQWTKTRRLFRGEVVNYLMGERWRRFYLKWRNPRIDKRTANVTAMAVAPDFTISMLFFAGLFPDTTQDGLRVLTGDIAMNELSPERKAEMLLPASMAFEQVVLGSSVGPVGASQGKGATDLSEPEFRSKTEGLLDRPGLFERIRSVYTGELDSQQKLAQSLFGNPQMVPQQRTQAFGQGFGQIGKSIVRHPAIYLSEHANYIEKLAGEAIPGYLLISTPFIAIAFAASTGFALGWEGMTAANMSAALGVGILSNFAILLAKYSFAGYAWLWPYAHTMTHLGFELIDHNRRVFNDATYLIHRGLRGKDKRSLTEGVEKMLSLHQVGKQKLPIGLDIPATQYTPELAQVLLAHSFEHMPVPTIANKKLTVGIINMGFLTIGTTVLYKALYSNALSISSVFEAEGTMAALGAFGNFWFYWAVLPLIGTYALARFGPELVSQETRTKVKEAATNTWKKSWGKSGSQTCRSIF